MIFGKISTLDGERNSRSHWIIWHKIFDDFQYDNSTQIHLYVLQPFFLVFPKHLNREPQFMLKLQDDFLDSEMAVQFWVSRLSRSVIFVPSSQAHNTKCLKRHVLHYSCWSQSLKIVINGPENVYRIKNMHKWWLNRRTRLLLNGSAILSLAFCEVFCMPLNRDDNFINVLINNYFIPWSHNCQTLNLLFSWAASSITSISTDQRRLWSSNS